MPFDPWVLRMLGLTGMITESVNFTDDEIHRSFVFVTQSLVRNGDEESMAAMFLVPIEITQFDSSKGKLLNATCEATLKVTSGWLQDWFRQVIQVLKKTCLDKIENVPRTFLSLRCW